MRVYLPVSYTHLELVIRQLLHRFRIQCSKKGRNYPFLMGQGIWIDSDSIGPVSYTHLDVYKRQMIRGIIIK